MSDCNGTTRLVGVAASAAKDPVLYTVIVAATSFFMFSIAFVDLGGINKRGYPWTRFALDLFVVGAYLTAFGVYGSASLSRQTYADGLCTGAVEANSTVWPLIRPPVDTASYVLASLCAFAFLLTWIRLAVTLQYGTASVKQETKTNYSAPFFLRVAMVGYLSTQASIPFGWASGRSVTNFQPEFSRNLLFASGISLATALCFQTIAMLRKNEKKEGQCTNTVMGTVFVGTMCSYFPLVTDLNVFFCTAVVALQYLFALVVFTNQAQATSYFCVFGLLPLFMTAVARDTSYFVPYFLFLNFTSYICVYAMASIPDPNVNFLLLEPDSIDTGTYDNGLLGMAMLTFFLTVIYVWVPASGFVSWGYRWSRKVLAASMEMNTEMSGDMFKPPRRARYTVVR